MLDPKLNATIVQVLEHTNPSSFCSAVWNAFLDLIGDHPETIYVWFLTFWINGLFWIIGGMFVLMDFTGKPAFMRKYKNQPGTNEPPNWNKLKGLMKNVFINQAVFGLPMSFLIYHVHILTVDKLPDLRVLPSIDVIVWDFAVCWVAWEISYYSTHRLFHIKYLYKHFHKKHHEWTSPVSWAGLYCHPLEFVISDMLPIFIGPAICNSHPVTIAIWFAFVILDVLFDHSGYHLPFLSSSEQHDFHHLKFNQNYGGFGVMDRVFKTNEEFRKKKNYLRHKRIFSLKSARELFPDEE